jgi:hypothetical protein
VTRASGHENIANVTMLPAGKLEIEGKRIMTDIMCPYDGAAVETILSSTSAREKTSQSQNPPLRVAD